MVRFLPSRLTLVRLAFFIALSGFTDLTTPGVFHYVIPMGSIIYFNKWERRRRNADRRGWWSSIKTSFIMPCIGANIASMIYGTIAGVFQGIAEPYSKADACYTFLDLPGVLRLADPNILWKNTVCDIVHDISRQDIAGTHGAFRYLYRTFPRPHFSSPSSDDPCRFFRGPLVERLLVDAFSTLRAFTPDVVSILRTC